MSKLFARYRKGIIATLGLVATYGSQVVPFLHGDAQRVAGAVLVIAGALATILSPPNAPPAEGERPPVEPSTRLWQAEGRRPQE